MEAAQRAPGFGLCTDIVGCPPRYWRGLASALALGAIAALTTRTGNQRRPASRPVVSFPFAPLTKRRGTGNGGEDAPHRLPSTERSKVDNGLLVGRGKGAGGRRGLGEDVRLCGAEEIREEPRHPVNGSTVPPTRSFCCCREAVGARKVRTHTHWQTRGLGTRTPLQR